MSSRSFTSTLYALLAFVFAAVSFAPSAFAEASSEDMQKSIEVFFEEFDKDPQYKMNQIPKKFGSQGQPLPANLERFTEEDITSGRYVEVKNETRARFCTGAPGQECDAPSIEAGPFAGFDGNNNPKPFLDDSKIMNVLKMDELELGEGRVEVAPWSGDYWGTYRGGLAARYADRSFPKTSKWKDYWNYYNTNIRDLNLFEVTGRALNTLSPTEKYDLLMQDSRKSLTNWSWNNAKYSENSKGEVETWFGLCHGWAPAAYRMDRPLNAVTVDLPGGEELEFTPDDIKGLGTLLWAQIQVPTLFLGGRCDDKKPKQDENGRVLSAQCFDTNPGAFHASVVNRIGVDKKSFVMDAIYDYEVWNHPIVSYKYTYFNPQTRRKSDSAETSAIPLEEYTKDKFSEYRTSRAKYVVGVMIRIEYTTETTANTSKTDSESNDQTKFVEYVYDLELDGRYNIVGGEWYQNAHPDFLWTPYENFEPKTYSDKSLTYRDWNGRNQPSADAQAAAQKESANGNPLALIIDKLVKNSRK